MKNLLIKKDLEYTQPMSKLLSESSNGNFFNQEEFNKNFGKITILSDIRIKIDKEIKAIRL